MQLARAAGNIIHSLTDETHNILWCPSNSLLDCAFFETEYRFYMKPLPAQTHMANPYNNRAITLQGPFFNYQHYALMVSSNWNDNAASREAHVRHISRVLIFNNYRGNIKREDWIILQQKNASITKICMADAYAQSWQLNNLNVIQYGVPLDILNTEEIDHQQDVLIHDTSMLGKQLKMQFEKEGIKTTLVEHFRSFEQFNDTVKKHKVFLTTALNGNFEALCATAIGASVVVTNSVANKTPCMTSQNDGSKMLETVKELMGREEDTDSERQFLVDKYPFDKFQQSVTDIFNTTIREAYIA